jgi:hypothetical protein
LRGDARLRDVGERIRKGDESDVVALSHPRTGTTVRGLHVPCNHYLLSRDAQDKPIDNRFNWWDAKVPETDAIRIRPGAETVQDALRDEFCSPFSTVVGADIDKLPPGHYGRTISWEDLPFIEFSPNLVPEIEFSVRTARPGCVPLVRTLGVDIGGRANRKVLINCMEEGQEPDPTQPRPSLFIDFSGPQSTSTARSPDVRSIRIASCSLPTTAMGAGWL